MLVVVQALADGGHRVLLAVLVVAPLRAPRAQRHARAAALRTRTSRTRRTSERLSWLRSRGAGRQSDGAATNNVTYFHALSLNRTH